MSALGQKRTCAMHSPCLFGPARTFPMRLLWASAAFCGARAFCSVGDIVRARVAGATVAGQNIAVAVASFERAILAIPIHAACAVLNYCAPRSVVSLGRLLQPEKRTGKTSDYYQVHAGHRQPPCSS